MDTNDKKIIILGMDLDIFGHMRGEKVYKRG